MKDDDCRWERSNPFPVPKFEASGQKPDFAMNGIVPPPARIGTGGNEADDRRARFRADVGFPHEVVDARAIDGVMPAAFLALLLFAVRFADALGVAIRGIHPMYDVALPVQLQRVHLRRVVDRAFRVLRQRAHIDLEVEFPVQRVEQVLRRRPEIGLRREKGGVQMPSPSKMQAFIVRCFLTCSPAHASCNLVDFPPTGMIRQPGGRKISSFSHHLMKATANWRQEA